MAICLSCEKEEGNDGGECLHCGGKKALQNVVQHFLHATLLASGRSELQLFTFFHDLKSLAGMFIDILVLVLQPVRKECGN